MNDQEPSGPEFNPGYLPNIAIIFVAYILGAIAIGFALGLAVVVVAWMLGAL